jgi:hypothetical protein
MTDPDHEAEIDPRLIFFLRAAARYELVEACAMDLDEAFGGLFDDLADTGAAA